MDVPFDQAGEVLCGDPGLVVADAVTAEDRRARRFSSMLGVEVGGGGVRQSVEIEIGDPAKADDAISLPVRWQASGRDRLFPVFAGVIDARDEGDDAVLLTVRGTYTVPLGALGRFGDGLIGRRVARHSLIDFVEHAADRLDREVHRRTTPGTWHPVAHPVELREMAGEAPG